MPIDLTDELLMQAVRDGDVNKLDLLYRRHRARLFSFFCHMNGSAASSEDLVQDVFFRMLKYRRSFRDESPFLKWMYQIARNARLQDFSKNKAGAGQPDLNDAGHLNHTEALPQHALEREQQTAMLEQALLELPEDRRELLVLARYQEMRYDDIAELLGIETGAVKVRVHRAMRELRETFLKLSGVETSCVVKK